MTTIYKAVTPLGAFQAEWRDDEDSRVEYSGSADAIAFFKAYLDRNVISPASGELLRFDTLEPTELYLFCQSEEAGIIVFPTRDDLMDEFEENDHSAAQSFDDGESDSEMVFNLFIEGELPEIIVEGSEDEPKMQVARVTTDAKQAQESEESADGDFLALASTGDVDFLDKAVTDRLAALANKYTAPESAHLTLIMQAKTAAKNFFISEFKKQVARTL